MRAQVHHLYGPATDISDDAELIVSEFVSNSFRAGAAHVQLEIVGHHRFLTVATTDDAPGEPLSASPTSEDLTGRGLRIVAVVSYAWGVRAGPGRGSKTVWADLAVTSEGTRSFVCDR